MKLKEIAGWVGVLLILLAYSLMIFEIISSKHILYGMMNLLGACGIIVSSYGKRDFQPIFLNLVWLIVAVFGIIINLT